VRAQQDLHKFITEFAFIKLSQEVTRETKLSTDVAAILRCLNTRGQPHGMLGLLLNCFLAHPAF
jgi:hypothetical protein